MNKTHQPYIDQGEGLFTRLYLEAFPATAAFISKRGGSLTQAKDIFQDALIIYYEQVYSGNTEIKLTEKAYLLGIAKNLWYARAKGPGQQEAFDSIDSLFIADIKEPDLSENKLMSFLETAGEKCMEMLKAFYYDKMSLSKISERFGFSGTRSATVQKYKCLEKVRDEVKERKLEYEDFTE
ncbi:MAG: sigma-70 family RNA polymerase sigma factor [Roseivirga sp.]|nr:sigma-70 family RNA polymerase sigma factor [Roseivirga sp.]